ncbi:MAG: hypothetical protein LUG56_01250 [Lachnospiraceae bacterium]|nr:hypothetical protein [Lachnospiraceae bacterium]
MGEEYKVIFMSRGEAEYLTNWILQMDDDWLSRNGILHQNCMHVRLYGGDFTHDHSTFRRGFADFCRLLFRNTNRILGQHKPDLRGKWEPKGGAMSENNEKKTTDVACAKDAGKQEDWMEQKIGGVEKKEGKRVFVQPGEGLKMNEDGSAVIQITANPGDEVILSYLSATVSNTPEKYRWWMKKILVYLPPVLKEEILRVRRESYFV